MEFDDDTARAIETLRRERGLGLSEAVNALVRRGMLVPQARPSFRQRTAPLGVSVDVSSVADALEDLEGAIAR